MYVHGLDEGEAHGLRMYQKPHDLDSEVQKMVEIELLPEQTQTYEKLTHLNNLLHQS